MKVTSNNRELAFKKASKKPYTKSLNFPKNDKTCIKRSHLGQRKSGLLRQMTS